MSQAACDLMADEIRNKPDILLCAATGDTPTLTYQKLAEKKSVEPGLFDNLRVIKLDEWGGLPMDDPATCETYIQKNVVGPLSITPERYMTFDSNPENPKKELKNFQKKLDKEGPIDVCILGLGMDGHIAFNEPASSLNPHAHINKLARSTRHSKMALEAKHKIKNGLTLGMADIMQSKKIILLVNGAHKSGIFKKFLSGKITARLPASMLWMHPDMTVICDKEAVIKIPKGNFQVAYI